MIERPNYDAGIELDGPHPAPLAVPWWVLPIVLVIACFAAGAVVSSL